MNQSKACSIALLLYVSIVWGLSSFFVQWAVASVPPITVTAVRLIIASLALHVFNAFQSFASKRSVYDPRYLLIAGLGQAIPFALSAWSLQHIEPAIASVLVAATPFFSVFLSRKRLFKPLGSWLALLVGFAALVGFIGVETDMTRASMLPYYLAILGAAFSFALAGLVVLNTANQPLLLKTERCLTCSAVMMTVLSIAIDHPWSIPFPSMQSISAIMILGLISTASAYVAYFWLIEASGLPTAATHHYFAPVFALLFQFFIDGIGLSVTQLLSLGLLLGSTVLLISMQASGAREAVQRQQNGGCNGVRD